MEYVFGLHRVDALQLLGVLDLVLLDLRLDFLQAAAIDEAKWLGFSLSLWRVFFFFINQRNQFLGHFSIFQSMGQHPLRHFLQSSGFLSTTQQIRIALLLGRFIPFRAGCANVRPPLGLDAFAYTLVALLLRKRVRASLAGVGVACRRHGLGQLLFLPRPGRWHDSAVNGLILQRLQL